MGRNVMVESFLFSFLLLLNMKISYLFLMVMPTCSEKAGILQFPRYFSHLCPLP